MSRRSIAVAVVQERLVPSVRPLSLRQLDLAATASSLCAILLLAGMDPGCAAELPESITTHLPPGYEVLGSAAAAFGSHTFQIVALGQRGEQTAFESARRGQGAMPEHASPRPLLLFERQPDGWFRQTGRNDRVVMHADEGGQCDPFRDGGNTIAVKGRYFTVENGVACGQHWTDYITFRFDDALGRYVFDNERLQSSTMNPSRDPKAEAMVASVPEVHRSDKAKPVPFTNWRPRS